MKKILFLIITILLSTNVFAAPPTRTYTYVPNTTIDPNQNNTNENSLYSYLQTGVDTYAAGSITGADISSTASIPYASLSLSNSIVNADINSSAAIVASKLVLTSPGAIGSVAPNTGAFTSLSSTSGTLIASLTGNVTGNVTGNLTGNVTGNITGNGTGQFLSSVFDYGTSSSISTSRNSSVLKIAFGTVNLGVSSSIAITGLPFTSSSTYHCTVSRKSGSYASQAVQYNIDSASQITLYDFTTGTNLSWECKGT